jgi:hypothetical protein
MDEVLLMKNYGQFLEDLDFIVSLHPISSLKKNLSFMDIQPLNTEEILNQGNKTSNELCCVDEI